MTVKDYKIISSRNFTMDRIAGNSLSCKPGTLLKIDGNFINKADTTDVVVGIAMEDNSYPSDNETTVQERTVFRPVKYHDQYIMTIKPGQTAGVSNIHNLYSIYTVPSTGLQTIDLNTPGNNIEIVDVITDTVVIVQIRHRVTQSAGSTIATNHNDLSSLQGGTTNEYYHLTASEYSKIILTDNVATLSSKSIDADTNTITNLELDNFKSSVIVIESEGIASNDNDTTIPTCASVKDYVDSVLTGIGAVTSVNGQTGAVTLDADDIDDTSTTHKFVTATDIGKLGNITVTQAVDLDQMETDIASLANGMVYKGNRDASAGTFPGAGSAQTGWFYTVSVGGTVDGVVFNVDDRLVGTIDNASTTTYTGNWTKLDATDAVTSVNSQTGNVVLDADDIDDTSTTNKFVTATDLTNLSNLSGTNTGDQDLSGLVAKSTYDAHTILYATTDNTPTALTVGEQTVVGRATGGNITALSIDSDLSSVSANDNTIPSAKATKAALDTKLPLAGGTMTGNIVLGENTSLQLDGVLSADGKWSGTTITATSGYAQAFGDLVYLDPTDSRREACDANAASGANGDCRGLIGMVVSAGTDGNACTILLQGTIRADANFPTLTVNGPCYASETAGNITQTAPTTSGVVVRPIGYALTADSILFQPASNFIIVS